MKTPLLRLRFAVLTLAALGSIVLIFALRMPQDPAYHLFADTRTCSGIPNFWNVASNLGFLLLGAGALAWLYRTRVQRSSMFVERGEFWIIALLFASTLLVAFGSGYYHLAPDNARLFWDRLPMALVASAFVASVFADRFGARAGGLVLAPLLATSVGALIYWRNTFMAGPDNVWPYYATVYGALFFAALTIVLFPSRYTHAKALWVVLGIYSIAMAFDTWLDRPLYLAGGVLSGHTLKHLLAAIALFWLAWGSLRLRAVKPSVASRKTLI